MKKIICSVISFLFLCGFSSLSSLNSGVVATTDSSGWEVEASGATIKAYNGKSKVELDIDISRILPSSVLCVSNKRIKDIKFTVSIHKFTKEGEGNWSKSFGKTRIFFSGKGGSGEKKVHTVNLIKDNYISSGGIINVGTLEFISPITCNNIDDMTMKISGMKDGNTNIAPLTIKINLKK